MLAFLFHATPLEMCAEGGLVRWALGRMFGFYMPNRRENVRS